MNFVKMIFGSDRIRVFLIGVIVSFATPLLMKFGLVVDDPATLDVNEVHVMTLKYVTMIMGAAMTFILGKSIQDAATGGKSSGLHALKNGNSGG